MPYYWHSSLLAFKVHLSNSNILCNGQQIKEKYNRQIIVAVAVKAIVVSGAVQADIGQSLMDVLLCHLTGAH